MALAVGSLVISSTLTGWLAIVVGMTSIIPQTRYVVTATSLAGVSVPMYALVVSSSVMWVAYGLVIGDPLVLMPHSVILPCGIYITSKVWRGQRAERSLVAEPI
ncbi:MAG: PQ-loop domain-containing transporter [Acidimicrobiia bacterium]